MTVTPQQTVSAWSLLKQKLEESKNENGVGGVFSRAQLEIFEGFVKFVEAEAKRRTPNDYFLHAIAAVIANMTVQIAQMTAAPGKNRLVIEEILNRARHMSDVKLGRGQSKLILPGLSH